MYAVIKTGGKQYRVKEGDLLDIEKLDVVKGQKIIFDQVLLIENDGQVIVGTPILASAAVKAEVVEAFKSDKVLIFKKKRRKQYRRTKGHRQELLKVRIEKIYPDTGAVPKEELEIGTIVTKPSAPEVPPAPAKKTVKAVKKEPPAEIKARKPASPKTPAKDKAAPKKKASGETAARPKKAAKE